ncbi:MAG: hypothetical protein WC480_04450 [Patescibacteria group bacterium]
MESPKTKLVILLEVPIGRIFERREIDQLAQTAVVPILGSRQYRMLAAEHSAAAQVTAYLAAALDHWEIIEVNRLLNLDIFPRSDENYRELLAWLTATTRQHPNLVLVTHHPVADGDLPRYFRGLLEDAEFHLVRL